MSIILRQMDIAYPELIKAYRSSVDVRNKAEYTSVCVISMQDAGTLIDGIGNLQSEITQLNLKIGEQNKKLSSWEEFILQLSSENVLLKEKLHELGIEA